MKRSPIISGFLVLLVLFSTIVQPVIASVTDVPTDHWAYREVVTLVNRGYLSTYEDGSFQGSSPVDRYTLAVTVARILDEIEAGRVIGSQSDADILRDLTTEFQAELVEFYKDKEAIETTLSETQRQNLVIEERVNNVVVNHQEFVDEILPMIAALKADLMETAGQSADAMQTQEELILTETANIEGKIKDNQQRIDELVNALIELNDEILLHAKEIDLYRQDILSLENRIQEINALFVMQDEKMTETVEPFMEDIKILSDELDKITEIQQLDIENMSAQLEELIRVVAKSDGDLLNKQEQLQTQLDNLVTRNQELEIDLQSLAVKIQNESKTRAEQFSGIEISIDEMINSNITEIQQQLDDLAIQVGIYEEEVAALQSQISDEIAVELNKALFRERGYSDSLQELQAEFDAYRETTDKEIKSAKSTAFIAIAAAAVSIVIGFIGGGQ